MKIALIYPLPADKPEVFRPDVDRFFETLFASTPLDFELDFEINVVCSGKPECSDGILPYDYDGWVDRVSSYIDYTGDGCDIGSHQHAAFSIDADLIICCSTRVYFHRPGWLKRIVEDWQQNGPTLCGAMGSFERSPHIRTCFYWLPPALFREYPHLIRTRDDTFDFETGKWNFTRWCAETAKNSPRIVSFSGWRNVHNCRTANLTNIYRRGDQSDCLAWDKHTLLYAEAHEDRKRVLEAYADGPK